MTANTVDTFWLDQNQTFETAAKRTDELDLKEISSDAKDQNESATFLKIF
jgi:hypothetical protein